MDQGHFLSRFKSWPNLRVLKVTGCSQIREGTFLNVPRVTHIHVDLFTSIDFFNLNIQEVKIHLQQRVSVGVADYLGRVMLPDWCGHLADLQLKVEPVQLDRYSASYMAEMVNRLLKTCTALHTFTFACVAARDKGNCVIVINRGAAAALERFRLSGIRCKEIDLHYAEALTNVSLSDVDSVSKPCKVALPSGLKYLSFFGSTLFLPDKNNLNGFRALKHVVLGSRVPGAGFDAKVDSLGVGACMPRLPSSLHYLHLTCLCTERLLNAHANSSLHACTNLKRLRYGYWERGWYEAGAFAWVRSARHVHIIDSDS